jgi:hypothetical protein
MTDGRKLIATGAAYGSATGKRTGTVYLYTEEEVRKHEQWCASINQPACIRRVSRGVT